MRLRLTLLADGSSDRALLPIVRWVLGEHTPLAFVPQFADTRTIPNPPSRLVDRVELALVHWPCELLFIHRDAEGSDPTQRFVEIEAAAKGLPHVPIVPVRMTEAWLLHDERAVRMAAGRPRGTEALGLPKLSDVENDRDPKETLYAALRKAHGASGRRARRFNVRQVVHDVAEHITDWSVLRQLTAFQRFEADVKAALAKLLQESREF